MAFGAAATRLAPPSAFGSKSIRAIHFLRNTPHSQPLTVVASFHSSSVGSAPTASAAASVSYQDFHPVSHRATIPAILAPLLPTPIPSPPKRNDNYTPRRRIGEEDGTVRKMIQAFRAASIRPQQSPVSPINQQQTPAWDVGAPVPPSRSIIRPVGEVVGPVIGGGDGSAVNNESPSRVFQMMNRNARKGKRANRGKRPCSRVRRRWKKRSWANTSRGKG